MPECGRCGNLIGPGRGDGFSVTAQAGGTLSSSVVDLGNGSYQVDVCTGPDSIEPPGIIVTQPGRDPVVVAPPVRLLIYSVKFVCGEQKDDCCGCAPVRPGRYSTEINILNPTGATAPVGLRPVPLVVASTPQPRAIRVSPASGAVPCRCPW